jgi:hypothetical protein
MFDQTAGFVLSRINNQSLRVEVQNSLTGETSAMTWSPVSYKEQTLVLSMNISDPVKISQNAEYQDEVVVQVLDKEMLTSRDKKFCISDDTELKKELKRQLKDDSPSRTLVASEKYVSATINSVAVVHMAINFFVAAGLMHLLSMMNSLQIMSFQTMLNVYFPANASLVSAFIIKILNVDLISPEIVNELLFDFTRDYQLIEESTPSILLPSIQEMGFETLNPILNLQGLFLIFVI